MKRLFAISAAIMLAAALASAQPRFGVTAGMTSSSSNVKDFKTGSVSLYHAGVTAKIPLGPIALQPAILYQVKGSALKDVTASVANAKFETKTSYVEIPVQIQVGHQARLLRPYAFAEPFIGVALSNKTKLTGQSSYSNKWGALDMSRWEYGLGLGAGIELLSRLQVSAKYFWNFGSLVNDESKVDSSEIGNTVKSAFLKGKNFNGLSISAAIFF